MARKAWPPFVMRLLRLGLPIAVLAAGVGGFATLKATRPPPPETKPQERIWRIETVLAEPGRHAPAVTLSGRIESPALTQAAAPGSGRVLRVLVREGEAIAPGQLLLELDARDFAPRVEQARGQVVELAAAIASERLRHAADLDQIERERQLRAFAAEEVARFERLRQENFYSPAAVDQARANLARQEMTVRNRELAIADHAARLAQFEARLAQARASLEEAELALQRARITAPFSGFVAKRLVAAGDQVSPGQPLISLYPRDGLEVRARIPAPYQDEIVARLARGERLPARGEIGGEELALELVRVAGTADAGGLDGFFRLREVPAVARVGSLVRIVLQRPPQDGAVPIPYAALYGGSRVYRVVEGRLQAVSVEVIGDMASAPGKPARLLVRAPELVAGTPLLATHLPNAVSGLRVEAVR